MPEKRARQKVVPLHPKSSKTASEAICTLEGVSLTRQGQHILKEIDLSIRKNRTTVLLGPNGAGKTMVLRLIAGLEAPLSGRRAFAPGIGERKVALVLQRPIFLRRTVHANLDHALALTGVPRRERVGRIAELLVMAELTHAASRPARALSGGEQQRLAIVRALALDPTLLLLDEPTSSLDPRATRAVERLVGDIRARGTSVLLVTHDVAQARRLAEDVIFLSDGCVVESGPAETFFTAPQSYEARAYLEGRLPEETGDRE